MLSLFALKLLWLFRLKGMLKLRRHTFKNGDKFFRVPPVLANARLLGRAKLDKTSAPGLTRREMPHLPGKGGGAGID